MEPSALEQSEQPPVHSSSKTESKVESSQRYSPEGVASFQQYIYQGGQLIKQGKYAEAIIHFRNQKELKKVGRRLGRACNRIINEPPKPEDFGELADSVARNSWNNPLKGTLILSSINYYTFSPDGRPQKQNIPLDLEHEVALVHMEEWLHCLQCLRRRPLAGKQDDEIDVAAYMKINGIPMTPAFLGRHNRAKALNKEDEN